LYGSQKTVAATKKQQSAIVSAQTINKYDDCQFETLVNSASMVALIGLPPKIAKFCHTSNRMLVVCG
jgi:hypothetical protein